ELGKVATVYRFDERGHGLSDRDVHDHRLELRVADLEAVVTPAGLDRFSVLAMSQGGPVTVEYAVRHPEQIGRLVFYGSHPGPHAVTLPEHDGLDEALTQLSKGRGGRPHAGLR